MESPFCGTTGMSSTLSRELKREEHVRLGLLEHELHDRRDVHSPLASISIPPWPGGVPPRARTTRTSPAAATTSSSWSVTELLD